MRRIKACRGSPTATWVEPTAQDNSGSQVMVTQSHIPGESVFKEGTTTVSYIFSDMYNNTSTCCFDVTVHRNSCQGIPLRKLYFAVYISWGIILIVVAILISIRICFYASTVTTYEEDQNDISLHEVRMT
ncbi:Sushi, von Willebrand factor type A, EGF and pentraxin domain-containing protein 1 [Holothuria leucospilota]|uniref:Sushi, von Willebrand factor type A, EGF and pentraxin domain-containing protein 1 n=1 Tax=Holothuria leucospilota TaxID=206669 RepID=A0A9Q1HEC9_HOLLE|nr:Sushi, von Willebrand factor type A, EGF and pentraxin domain-containing protein 1 [Holothuria leucospilota]